MRNSDLFAEDVNYWQTSKSSPDRWLDRAKREIVQAGGEVVAEGFLSEPGKAAFMLAFVLGSDSYKMIWPVLEFATGKTLAARVQAATALYHEVKSACVKMKFLGIRTAFFAYLMLPDGRVASEVSTPELAAAIPEMFLLVEPSRTHKET